MMAVIQENLNATRVVKAFHQEKKEIDKFEEVNEAYRIKLNEMIHALAVFWNVSDFIGAFQLFLMVMGGIYFASKGEITAGTFFVFLTYENMIIWPIRQLGRILADMGKLSVSIGRIEEVLNEPCEDLDCGLLPEIKGDIVFDHVSFAYPDSDEEILKDLSFHISPYTKTAIMGATGSGKSSLIHLLNGIYDYSSGSIKLDGVELREINKHHLRRNVQLVLQEPFLYSKTIYENIVLPSSENIKDEVEKAAKSARIHHVIEEFDQGYDTEVGEKGVMLSGGQKQRMAIARSLIVHSPVVIFDDSLSALDSKTDAKIQEELANLENLMTTIMVTHRINTACKADQIIVLEKGRIVQCGSHEELIHQEGIYQRIYQIQNEGGGQDVIN